MTKNLVTGVIAATILLVLPAAVGVAEDAKKPQAAAETAGVAPGKRFVGFERGMGIGGWLPNYKRFNVLPDQWRGPLSPGDFEHFDTYITQDDVRNIASFGVDHIRLGFDQVVLEEKPGVYRERTFRLIDYLSTPNDGNRFSLVDDDTRAILSPRLLRIIQGLE